VLDAFGGWGVTWKAVTEKLQRKDIMRIGIDEQNRPGCVRGNNLKWLSDCDLSLFDVIDLDAYGIPFEQMEILFRRRYRGVVFWTFIQSVMGRIPDSLIAVSGLNPSQVLCPTLISSIGWELWQDYLALHGVTRIWYYEHGRKRYGCHIM
jgi:hypothetical protein